MGLATSAAWRPTTRRRTRAAPTPCTRSRRPRRSPGSPRASSGSICPTSSTTSRSTSRSPPSRRPATPTEALQRLAADFREPAAVSACGRVLAAAHRRLPERRSDVGNWQAQLDQIVGNWGRFEPTQSQPAGRGPTLNYRFRNGDHVDFTAREIDVKKLLDDVKDFLKSSPHESRLAEDQHRQHRLSAGDEKQEKYFGRQVARWQMPLRPREKHFDRLAAVHPPLSTPGAYLVDRHDAGRKHLEDHRLDRRHGDREENAFGQGILLRRRRRQRQADRQGERRVLRLAAALSRKPAEV